MRKLTFTIVFLCLVVSSAFTQQEHYLKFQVDKKAEIENITRMISIDNVKGDTVYAYANDKQLAKFKKKTDYKLNILPHPRTRAKSVEMATTVAEMSNWDKYPTYDVYVQMMNNFANDYPNICSLENIGTTIDGRDLLVLKISDNVNQEEDEPEFFYTSTMHGDETAGFIFMLRFVDSLLTNYGSKPGITDLVNNIAIYVNPNANPDGTYSSGNSTVSGATRSNADGIDINRNFPDPEDGEHPDGNDWQPETIAMMDFAEQHNFTLSANFHGGAEVANYPWDTWFRSHVDDAWLDYISHVYADPAMANSPSGYFTDVSDDGVTNGADWYSISGGRQDYMTYFHQCREVTMEVSSQKLLSTDDLRSYWNYNRQSLFDYMEQSLYGIRGIVTDENGDPLEAMVRIKDHDAEIDSSMVFTDPVVGDYHRMIDNGTYDVMFSSYGYFTDTVQNVTVNTDDSVRVNVSLTPKSTYSISGTVTNGETGNPIENAEVTVKNSPLSSVYTNASGEYTLNNVMEGQNTLQVRKSGYATVIADTLVSASETTFNFELFEADIEDFESGDFSSFAWNFGGSANWEVVSSEFQEGSYAAKSGNITDEEQSTLSIDIAVEKAGDLSFYKKVSSESTYDFLKFFIDGTEKDSWSGEINWSEETYTLSEGTHTLTWKYEKDYSASSGSDCAWIDYIKFPQLYPPDLNYTPDTIETSMEVNSNKTESLELTNTGNGVIDFSLSVVDAASNPWISPGTSNGSLSSMQTESVDIEISTGPEDSVYTCDLLLSHNGSKGDTTIPVTVHSNYYPELSVNPVEIEDEILMDSMKTVYIKLNNTGTGVLDYNAEIENPSENSWLSLQGSTGSIDDETDSLKVTFDATGMPSGIYNANILINDNSKGQTQIPVNLIINEPESFVVNPEDLSISLKRFENETHSFCVKNIIPETLDIDLSLEDSTHSAMFQLDTNQAHLNSGDSTFFDLDIKPQGIVPGEYSCNIIVQSEMRYIKKLQVTTEVKEQQILSVNPDSISITMGKFEVISKGINIENLLEQDIQLHYSLSDSSFSSVLQLNQEEDTLAGITEINKSLDFKPEKLDPGNYYFSLFISSGLRNMTEVPVTLKVAEQPVLSVNPGSININIPAGETDTSGVFLVNHSDSLVEYNLKKTLEGYEWIDVKPMNDTIQDKDSLWLKTSFYTENLDAGEYEVNVKMAQSYNDSVYTLPVTLTVDENISGVSGVLSEELQVDCYPNPFRNQLNVMMEVARKQDRLVISVINDKGQVIISRKMRDLRPGKYSIPINLSEENLKRTNYLFLRINDESGVISKKILHVQ